MLAMIAAFLGVVNPATYLMPVSEELVKAWPGNRAVTIVCHGHSVPAGYAVTPVVDTFSAYPHLIHKALKDRFPLAVINVIVTAIGGENSVSGAARFSRDVLPLRPDVVLIDYSLNDRGVSLAQSRTAWVSMIRAAKVAGAKVILLTPTPDQTAKMLDPNDPLSQNAEQVRKLAAEEEVGLVDSYARFQEVVQRGEEIKPYMAQVNHPNRKGHEVVAAEIMRWFPEIKKP